VLKFVFFLVAGAFVIGAALGVLVMALQAIGYVLTYLFKFLAWVFRKLELACDWGRERWHARLTEADAPAAVNPEPQEQKEDVPVPQAEPPVAPVLQVIAPLDPDNIDTAQAEPAADVSHVEAPI
jgi:hypothetical protein